MSIDTIAEIGQAHDGSIGILHSYIDALSKTGVKSVKFQMHNAAKESSKFEKFRIKFSLQDKTRFDYWKRMELTEDQWFEVKKHCEIKNVEFLCTPFSISAFKLLEKLKVKKYKIGSADLDNKLLLEYVARSNKEIIISTGLSSIKDIDNAVNFIRLKNNKDITILECISKYPHSPSDVRLGNLSYYKKRYNCKVGLSDHSGSIIPSIAAATLGADVLEFHSVFSRDMFGPDSTSSLTMQEITDLVKNLKIIEKIKNKRNLNKNNSIKNNFSRSIIINKSKKKNSTIKIYDLEAVKPAGKGINPKFLDKILNRKLNKGMVKNSYLNFKDIK